jgi:hypothetical protein
MLFTLFPSQTVRPTVQLNSIQISIRTPMSNGRNYQQVDSLTAENPLTHAASSPKTMRTPPSGIGNGTRCVISAFRRVRVPRLLPSYSCGRVGGFSHGPTPNLRPSLRNIYLRSRVIGFRAPVAVATSVWRRSMLPRIWKELTRPSCRATVGDRTSGPHRRPTVPTCMHLRLSP